MAGILLNRSRQVPAEQTPAFGGIAERFRRAGDLERAIALCLDGLKRFPDQLSARVTLGWSYLDKGQYDDARAELERVLRKAPDNLAAIRGLAELHDRSEAGMPSLEDRESYDRLEKAIAEAKSAEAAPAGAVSAPIAAEPAADPFASIPVAFAASEAGAAPPQLLQTADEAGLAAEEAAAFDPHGPTTPASTPVELEDPAAASMAAVEIGVDPVVVVDTAAATLLESPAAAALPETTASKPVAAVAAFSVPTPPEPEVSDVAVLDSGLPEFDPGLLAEVDMARVFETLDAGDGDVASFMVITPNEGLGLHLAADIEEPVLALESPAESDAALADAGDVTPLLESLGAEFAAGPDDVAPDVVIEVSDEPAFALVAQEPSEASEEPLEIGAAETEATRDELTADLIAVIESAAVVLEEPEVGMAQLTTDESELEVADAAAGSVEVDRTPVLAPVEPAAVTEAEPVVIALAEEDATSEAIEPELVATEPVEPPFGTAGVVTPDEVLAEAEDVRVEEFVSAASSDTPTIAAIAIGSAIAVEALSPIVEEAHADVFGLYQPVPEPVAAAPVAQVGSAEVISIASRRDAARAALPGLERMLRKVEARRLQLRSETVA